MTTDIIHTYIHIETCFDIKRIQHGSRLVYSVIFGVTHGGDFALGSCRVNAKLEFDTSLDLFASLRIQCVLMDVTTYSEIQNEQSTSFNVRDNPFSSKYLKD